MTDPTARLADGEWHRLHPATPLLRGGIGFIAVLGIVVSNLRERIFNAFIGSHFDDGGDPLDALLSSGQLPIALLVLAGLLVLSIALFYVAWRVHSFRITDELVEVRSGILRRTSRQGRLDRIQGINIVRPLFARLFGAARLEIDVAGSGANVRLDYLSSSNADALRRDILRLASGTRAREASDAQAAALGGPAPLPGDRVQVAQPSFLDQRVAELLAPELDPDLAPPESVVKLHVGRLIGSIVLHDTFLWLVGIIVAAGVISVATGRPYVVVFLFGPIVALGSFAARRFTKSLRYTIAGTPDGVRIGFGLLSLSNETLPPGRIHSVQVRQPLLWRLPGWWEIRVNRASKSAAKGAEGQQNTTVLPVGNMRDVIRVLDLLLPGVVTEDTAGVVERGLVSRGGDDGYVNSPRRAAIVRWFAWRRTGFAFAPGSVLLRTGLIWRQLTIVPEARVQSVGIRQGPVYRMLGLAHLDLHTVTGPITAQLGAVDRDVALGFFSDVSLEVVSAVQADQTHRWRAGEVSA